MLWTDKYRPKTFDDVVGNVKQKAIIQKICQLDMKNM